MPRPIAKRRKDKQIHQRRAVTSPRNPCKYLRNTRDDAGAALIQYAVNASAPDGSVKPHEFRGFDLRRVDRIANAERVSRCNPSDGCVI